MLLLDCLALQYLYSQSVLSVCLTACLTSCGSLMPNCCILPLDDHVASKFALQGGSCHLLLLSLPCVSRQHREDDLLSVSPLLFCVFVCLLTRFRSKSNQPRRRHVSLRFLLVCPLSLCLPRSDSSSSLLLLSCCTEPLLEEAPDVCREVKPHNAVQSLFESVQFENKGVEVFVHLV